MIGSHISSGLPVGKKVRLSEYAGVYRSVDGALAKAAMPTDPSPAQLRQVYVFLTCTFDLYF